MFLSVKVPRIAKLTSKSFLVKFATVDFVLFMLLKHKLVFFVWIHFVYLGEWADPHGFPFIS